MFNTPKIFIKNFLVFCLFLFSLNTISQNKKEVYIKENQGLSKPIAHTLRKASFYDDYPQSGLSLLKSKAFCPKIL